MTAQVMVTKEVAAAVGGLKDLVPTGTSVLIEGKLTEAPAKAKQVLHWQPAFCSMILTCRGFESASRSHCPHSHRPHGCCSCLLMTDVSGNCTRCDYVLACVTFSSRQNLVEVTV